MLFICHSFVILINSNLLRALYCCNLQQAHSSCHYMLPKQCGFGYLHKFVLPPYAVSMPNTTLWSSCSQNRCRSATLSGELGVIYSSLSTSRSRLVENKLDFQLFCKSTLTTGLLKWLKIESARRMRPSVHFLLPPPRTASLHVLDLRFPLFLMTVFLYVSLGRVLGLTPLPPPPTIIREIQVLVRTFLETFWLLRPLSPRSWTFQ